MAFGVSFITCGESVVKLLTLDYSPFQILFIRSAIALPLLLILWKKDKPFTDIFRVNVKDQLIRNGVLALAILLAFFSLSLIPLFQYSSLFFSSPFFIVIFSIFLLGETVSKAIWLSLITGFLGVVIIFNPSSSFLFEIGSLAAILAAAFMGLGMVLTSKLSKLTSPLLMTLWYTGTCLIVGMCGSLGHPLSLHLNDFLFFGLTAFFNIGANLTIIKSFQCTPASYLAPVQYLAIPLSALLGYLIWEQLPGEGTLIGSLLVIGSGLYIFKREKKLLEEKKEDVILGGDVL